MGAETDVLPGLPGIQVFPEAILSRRTLVMVQFFQGSKSESEMRVIRDFRHVFTFIRESVDLWQAAGELSGALLRKGKSVGLAHCYLAAAAKENGLAIFTRDRHFELLRAPAGISLYAAE